MTARPILADFELFERTCSFRRCGARILWARTNASGRKEWMPLDADPSPRGNVLAYPAADDSRMLVCDVLPTRGRDARRAAGMRADGWLLFVHHRTSCPHADEWARGPKALRPQPTGIRRKPEEPSPPPPEGLFDA